MTRTALLAALCAALNAGCAAPDGSTALTAAATAAAGTTVFDCGASRVVVTAGSSSARVLVDGRSFEMRPVRAASGALYEVQGNPATRFWDKGERATLTVADRTYPECVRRRLALPLRALGNEPSWRLDISDSGLTLLTDFGARRVTTAAPATARSQDATVFSATAGGGEITATVVDRVCRDSMSGMPFPYTVTVRDGANTLRGCGGEPAALLRARDWVVAEVDGRAIIDRSRLSVNFDAAGGVSGLAGCNSYSGRYVLSGEGLNISDLVTTRKACTGALMEQETRFIGALGATRRFDIAGDGALRLIADEPRTIIAR